MALCSACQGIFDQSGAHKILSLPSGLEFTRSPNSILSTAIKGCPFCRELLFNGNKPGHRVDNILPVWPVDEWTAAIEQEQDEVPPQTQLKHRSRFSEFLRWGKRSPESPETSTTNLAFNIKQHESGEGLVTIVRKHSNRRLLEFNLSALSIGTFELSARSGTSLLSMIVISTQNITRNR